MRLLCSFIWHTNTMAAPQQYFLSDDGIFPNSKLPVLFYRQVLRLPSLFPAATVKSLFKKNGWTNNWRAGVFTFHHYHSNTHEVLGVISGASKLQLGGGSGIILTVSAGDVIIIPAGVAHRNLGNENDIICIGGYPDGKDFDVNYGNAGERPHTDRRIARIAIPVKDPVMDNFGLPGIWSSVR